MSAIRFIHRASPRSACHHWLSAAADTHPVVADPSTAAPAAAPDVNAVAPARRDKLCRQFVKHVHK
ncbi:MAG: hypothetical protein IPN23_03900 [Elusimicrobia bacterium]|nr:hypothetical protein [Elusimicrobiota bacterium]